MLHVLSVLGGYVWYQAAVWREQDQHERSHLSIPAFAIQLMTIARQKCNETQFLSFGRFSQERLLLCCDCGGYHAEQHIVISETVFFAPPNQKSTRLFSSH